MFARLVPAAGQGESGPPKLLALGDPAYAPKEPEPTPPTPPDHGIAILALQSDGTAERHGIRPGDVLLEYNGTILNSAADLKIIPAGEGGMRIPIKLWRNGEVRQIEVSAGILGIRHQPDRKAADVVLAQRAAAEVVKPLTRGAALDRLPGTRREVERIA